MIILARILVGTALGGGSLVILALLSLKVVGLV
jgi:hypothetical protein